MNGLVFDDANNVIRLTTPAARQLMDQLFGAQYADSCVQTGSRRQGFVHTYAFDSATYRQIKAALTSAASTTARA